MNPEFKRNLWQELSLQRIVAMPIIILAIFFVASLKYELAVIPAVALALIMLLLVIWGSGLAADAIFQEIRDRTWDALRMTPLGPWSMAWGKLLGSTIFVWYGTFWCAITYIMISIRTQPDFQKVLFLLSFYLLIGFFTQAFALFTALLFQRISPLRSRARTVFIQLFAILVGSLLFALTYNEKSSFDIHNGQSNLVLELHTWYNLGIQHKPFVLGSIIFFCLSLLFGVYRLLRSELQMNSFPWGLPLFIVMWIVYLWGFAPLMDEPQGFMRTLYAGLAYIILLKATFLSAFFTPKNIIYYFRWVNYFKEGNYKKIFELTPSWVLTGVMGLITLVTLVLFLNRIQYADTQFALGLIGFSLSIFFFLLRDVGVLYYLTFNFHSKRAHLATVVYLTVLYTLIPMLLFLTPISSYWYPAIAPWVWMFMSPTLTASHIVIITSLVLLQAVVAWSFVLVRWREATQQLV